MRELTAREGRLWRRAQSLLAANLLDDARNTLESLLELIPEHTKARLVIAGIIMAKGGVRAASEQLRIAADAPPTEVGELCMLALALLRIGEVTAARDCMDDLSSRAQLDSTKDLATVAHVYQTMGEHAKALAMIERARELGHTTADFSYFRSIQLMFNNRLTEAAVELETCLQLKPVYGRAALTRARLGRQTLHSNHVDDLQERLRFVESGSVDHAALEFALFKELDDLGDMPNAWRALERGNEIMHRRMPHDSESEKRLFDLLIQTCTPEFLRTEDVEHDEGLSPIFIIGMPRSGTTLLERILGSHSQVASAGELDDFAHQLRWQADCHSRAMLDDALLQRAATQDYANIGRRYLQQTRWRAGGKRYFVDKLPPNYMFAGFIGKALPSAPILHIVREPMDVCFSNYKALFGDAVAYSYSLETVAAHHCQYARLMQHWREAMPGRILDVPYAELVADVESVARRILEHCGLPWESQVIDMSQGSAPVATLSTAQVREPIHARSIGEWRRYVQQLEPLRAALAGA